MASSIYRLLNCPGMAAYFGKYILVPGCQTLCKNRLYLSTSSSSMIKWRYEQDIEPNPNRFGPLTNLPDYSYVDGRPVPLSRNLQKKLELQKSYCERILKLCKELDFAVERHKNMDEEKKAHIRKLIESRFKEKGERKTRQSTNSQV